MVHSALLPIERQAAALMNSNHIKGQALNRIGTTSLKSLLVCAVVLLGICGVGPAQAIPAEQSPAAPTVRAIGTVQSIQGGAITLKTDAGAQVDATVQSSTRLLRIQPGQKSLKDAMPLKLQDLQVGDRILVLGVKPEGSKAVLASSIIAIKRSDLALRQQQEEEEWVKNGVGGIVRTVDPETGAITLAPNAAGKVVTVKTTKETIFRRYAPGSVRFQDAKASTFAGIKQGDQLRARGTLSADGTELSAAEIVSGTFENIAGTVLSVDPGSNRLTVMDLMTKHPVTVSVSPSSELRQLPESEASEIAMRVHGSQKPRARSNGAAPPAAGPSLDQLVRQLPPMPLSELHKGDMVMIVSTEGTVPGLSAAVKLVSGVAPILTASRGGNQGKTLQSLWSGFGSTGGGEESGGAGGGGGAAPQQK